MNAHRQPAARTARLARVCEDDLPRDLSVLVPCQRRLAQGAWAGRAAADARRIPTSVFALAEGMQALARPWSADAAVAA